MLNILIFLARTRISSGNPKVLDRRFLRSSSKGGLDAMEFESDIVEGRSSQDKSKPAAQLGRGPTCRSLTSACVERRSSCQGPAFALVSVFHVQTGLMGLSWTGCLRLEVQVARHCLSQLIRMGGSRGQDHKGFADEPDVLHESALGLRPQS